VFNLFIKFKLITIEYSVMRYRGGYSVRDYVPNRINEETGKLELQIPLANYVGPGTDVIRRVKEGVKPTTNVDAAAKQHDLDYYNIRTGLRNMTLSLPAAKEKVRESDNRLINEAKRNLITTNPINLAHAAAASSGIGLKKIAENIGIMDKLHYVGKGSRDPLKRMRKQLLKGH